MFRHCLAQCAPACFEGLFPAPFDDMVQDLLATMATWHAYAKLRLHTENTLASFDALTKPLGRLCRVFSARTAKRFSTKPLPGETAAKARRKAANAAKKAKNKTAESDGRPQSTSSKKSTKKKSTSPAKPTKKKSVPTKTWNLFTYKFHSLGDYVAMIRMFGTTDSYSTQTVCVYVTICRLGGGSSLIFYSYSRANSSINESRNSTCGPIRTNSSARYQSTNVDNEFFEVSTLAMTAFVRRNRSNDMAPP